MWVYCIREGELYTPHGELEGVGYAGHGAAKNDPERTNEKNLGPLPCGRYRKGTPFLHPTAGKFFIPLTPAPRNEMFGRSGFGMHGDSIKTPGTASEGCVIQPLNARMNFWASPDRDLLVVRDRSALPA